MQQQLCVEFYTIAKIVDIWKCYIIQVAVSKITKKNWKLSYLFAVDGTDKWTKVLSWTKTLDTGHYGGGEMFVALDWRWTVLYHRTPSFLSSLLLSVSVYLHLSRYLSWYLVIRSWLCLLMTEGASSAIIFAETSPPYIRVWRQSIMIAQPLLLLH